MQDNSIEKRYLFLLLDGFPLMPFTNAIELLRIANCVLKTQYYGWMLVSDTGSPVICSCNVQVTVDSALVETTHRDAVIVCAGNNVRTVITRSIINWIRAQSRNGCEIIGLGAGAYALARSGLLKDKKATISTNNRDSFVEEFPDIELKRTPYVIDGKLYTASDGFASLDLIFHIMSECHGSDFAFSVADMLNYSTISTFNNKGHQLLSNLSGMRHPKVVSVIQMMEENTEDPISPWKLAQIEGISVRQLERLFRRHLNRSPKRYYMEVRLQKARNLLLQTDMPILEVGVASGFLSSSHFARWYKLIYGLSPYQERLMQVRSLGSHSSGASL